MSLLFSNRYNYSAIIDRAHYTWPQGKQLALFFTISLECFDFGKGFGPELRPTGGAQPDIVNFTWRDYGLRVGIWRMLELFDQYSLPLGVLVNSYMCDYAPRVIQAFIDRGDEIIAHGRTNSEKQGLLSVDQETELIAQTTQRLTQFTGVKPTGWLGPWISESFVTPDLLSEQGYSYILDWCFDDQPIWLTTRHKPLLAIPVNQEINDLSAIIARQYTASYFAEMVIDHFNEMLNQSNKQPLVLGIPLHPFVMGQPYRLVQLRKMLSHIAQYRDALWIARPHQIADYSIRNTSSF